MDDWMIYALMVLLLLAAAAMIGVEMSDSLRRWRRPIPVMLTAALCGAVLGAGGWIGARFTIWLSDGAKIDDALRRLPATAPYRTAGRCRPITHVAPPR